MTPTGRRSIGVGTFVVIVLVIVWGLIKLIDRDVADYQRRLRAHDEAMLAACLASGGRPVTEPSTLNMNDPRLRLSLCVPDGVGTVDLGRRER